ncbi:MAG TPA: ATP-binding cassette domain-containing protein [Planctomicrobium sp.]|nr:ATP-binding cassette domain-containing protein [Planctomicrobium sp.]
MTNGVTVETCRVQRNFGRNVVLRQLDFSILSGEFVAVVGRSGCGKSTLLRLLAGLDLPDSGDVLIQGEALTGICPWARIMFQDGRLLPWKRVGENVGLGLPNADRGRITDLLNSVGLAHRIDDWPGVLSGGQKQRVALARALAAQPRLLLLDEPLGSLDALTRVDMQNLIESLWRRSGATAVLITHDVEEAVALADRVVLLADGQVAKEWLIDLPRPRRRTNPVFTKLVQRIDRSVRGLDERAANHEFSSSIVVRETLRVD